MKSKYIIISVLVVAVLCLGAFLWVTVKRERNQFQMEQTAHADGEEKEPDEHGIDESNNPDEHAGHDEQAEEEGEEGHAEDVVRLSDAELREFGITLKTAQGGALNQYTELPGEIVLNADRIAHVVPRVPGIVRDVLVTVGDAVEKGELLAVLESRQLADAKASYLAAIEREKLAQANFQREERLWETKVTSEQEYLDARQVLAETLIAKSSAEQQLHALGFNENDLKELASSEHASFTHYTITAPFSGTVIEKHITFGENVGDDVDVFTIADLSTVWVNVNIYQKDLVSIRKGQTVEIEIGHGIPSAEGTIAWVGPQVDEGTRTATARIELPNPDGSLRPGLFVTAKVAVGSLPAEIVVPKTALQTFEGKTVVFVRTDEGFEPHPVELGRQNGATAEVISGILPGQTYAAKGSFTLKAQLSKGAFGDGHNH
ncbi:MAG: efflux RND transporter periplasmic adaptor subunit [Verrucomicrobiota bacterium]|nr:efflux RND transporter periplasmic adaptor subunit [Verrucomicrobiota bacterium]MDD8049785.1 efflux RND transporter periplasmic adaptor subunit [Verrucomicrobiota bacterium]